MYYTFFPKLRSLDNKYFMFRLNEMKENINILIIGCDIYLVGMGCDLRVIKKFR